MVFRTEEVIFVISNMTCWQVNNQWGSGHIDSASSHRHIMDFSHYSVIFLTYLSPLSFLP